MIQKRSGRGRKSSVTEKKTLTSIFDALDEERRLTVLKGSI